MQTYSFTLLLEGANVLDTSVLDTLCETGAADALFGEQSGVSFADFDREAGTLLEAVISAIEDVERAVPGLRVYRVEPEEFTSAADIAARTGRSRESISQLVKGERGLGSFPQPALRVGHKRPLWRWSEVALWFERYQGEPVEMGDEAETTAVINGALDLRRFTRELAPSDQARLASWVEEQALGVLQAVTPSARRRHLTG